MRHSTLFQRLARLTSKQQTTETTVRVIELFDGEHPPAGLPNEKHFIIRHKRKRNHETV